MELPGARYRRKAYGPLIRSLAVGLVEDKEFGVGRRIIGPRADTYYRAEASAPILECRQS